jgi:hypothetical protein
MKICYFDESGDSSILPSSCSDIQPLLVIAALAIDAKYLRYLTKDFLGLKRRYFPNLDHDPAHDLSWIKSEIKGHYIRKHASSSSRNKRRHAIGFLEQILKLVENYEGRTFGRIWVKGIGREFKEVPVYTSSVQSIYAVFNRYLEDQQDHGVVIGDSRTAGQNVPVAHSIFSKKMAASGDVFDRILDLPAFAHSENSACLQIVDLIGSAIIWPIAIETYCKGVLKSCHVKDGYDQLKHRLCPKISKLQYRYLGANGKKTGGFTITNKLSSKAGREFFLFPQQTNDILKIAAE